MKFHIGDRISNKREFRIRGILLLGTIVKVYWNEKRCLYDVLWDVFPNSIRRGFAENENSLYTYEDFEDKIRDRISDV